MTEAKDALFAFATRNNNSNDSVGSKEDHREATWKRVQRVGIATAVFRETSNGPAVLDQIAQQFHCSVTVASQQLEGILGYRTGCLALIASASHQRQQQPKSEDGGATSVARTSSSRSVVWDSGGASFQLTLEQREGHQLAAYEGEWGSSKATRAVVEDIQGRTFPKDSPNPMTKEDVTRSIDYFIKAVDAKDKSDAEKHAALRYAASLPSSLLTLDDLRHAVARRGSRTRKGAGAGLPVVAIGGPTSAFRMTSLLVRLHEHDKKKKQHEGSDDTTHNNNRFVFPKFEEELPSPVITCLSLLDAVDKYVVGNTDAYLKDLGFPQYEMLGPKVCLVLGVMRYLGMPSFQYVPTVGSTLGIAEACANGTLFGAPKL